MRTKKTDIGKYRRLYVGLTAMCLCIILLMIATGCSSQKEAKLPNQFWGRADAKEIDINSKIAGRVVELDVKEGDLVKKDQILVHIDQRDLQIQAAQAQANINALQEQLKQASTETTMQNQTTLSTVDVSHANLDSMNSNLQLAKNDYLRYQKLLGEGAVSKQDFDTYRTKYETAQAAYAQAAAGVSSANAGLMQTDVDQENEQAIQKKIEQAEASLEQINIALDETLIRAPYDGVITEKYVEEGLMLYNKNWHPILKDCDI